MSWRGPATRGRLTEWERSDGEATVRLRELPDGTFAVRLDRMHGAPEGSLYRREAVEKRDAAASLAAEWRVEYDVSE